jgi:Uncharacterized conserved protein
LPIRLSRSWISPMMRYFVRLRQTGSKASSTARSIRFSAKSPGRSNSR